VDHVSVNAAQREILDVVVYHPTEAVHIDGASSRLDSMVFSSVLACMRYSYEKKLIASQGDLFFVKREDFRAYVGRAASNNDDDIIESCNKMFDIKFRWNTMSKGKVRFGGQLNFLSTFSLTERPGHYAFRVNPDLTRMINFLRPQLYGKYRLLQLQALTGHYSRRLFVFLMDDLGRMHGEGEPELHVTEPCKVETLKSYLNASQYPRYKEFKFFRAEVLNEAMADISSHSGYKIELVLHKLGRNVDAVSFKLSRNVQLFLSLGPASGRDALVDDMRGYGIEKSASAKWLSALPVSDVQRVWDYVKEMHQKSLKQKGLVGELLAKARRAETQKALDEVQAKMRAIHQRCEIDFAAATRADWLGLSADERASLWQSLESVQERRIPTWCAMGIKAASLDAFLVDGKLVEMLCGSAPAVEAFFGEFRAAMYARFGGGGTKLLAIKAANGYEDLRKKAASLEQQLHGKDIVIAA
jgi:Initiator Replication protein